MRPHTDPSLGHCSYLNTCYSEPTYALSPSIPPFPSSTPSTPTVNSNASRPNSNVSLPSGLGAGGRGKEKAPCRYLHFEVDYDGTMADAERERRRLRNRRDVERARNGFGIVGAERHRLSVGCGPSGRLSEPVSISFISFASRKIGQAVLIIVQYPPQWINCDLRRLDYSVLGKFHVIMADPPWDIHMSAS